MRRPSGRTPGAVDLADPALHGPDDVAAVGAAEHHDHPADDLALPVLDGPALADGLTGRNLRHVPDEDGRSRLGLQRDGADVPDGLEEPDAADEILLFAVLQDVAADVEVVPAEGLADFGQGQVVGVEPVRIDDDVILLDRPAEGVDLADAGDRLEQRREDPVLGGPDFGQPGHLVRPGRPLPGQGVLVDLAHRGRDRSHGDLGPLGDAFAGLDQPLEDELAGEIDVDPVLEDDGDDGEPGLGDRADLIEPGQAAHGRLDRVGDEALDLGRRHARDRGQHLDLDVGDVGEGVDGDAQDGPDAERDEESHADEDERAPAQGAFDDPVKRAHVRPPGCPCGSRT